MVLNKQWGVAGDIKLNNPYIFFPFAYLQNSFVTVAITNGNGTKFFETIRTTDKTKFSMGGLAANPFGISYISIGK